MMCDPLKGPADQQLSNAMMALLRRFERAQEIEAIAKDPNWGECLGEAPNKTLERLVNDGMLRPPTAGEYLESKSTVAALKALLQQRQMKVSGRKADLIERLLSGGVRMEEIAANSGGALICTELGAQLVHEFTQTASERAARARAASFDHFRAGRIASAIGEARQYYTSALNYYGNPIGWSADSGDLADRLHRIATSRTPTIVRGAAPDVLAAVREALCMAEIWSDSVLGWLPHEMESGFRYSPDVIARMVYFSIRMEDRIAIAKEIGCKAAEVVAVKDSCTCAACKAIAGKTYRLANLPELPLPQCTGPHGCRCDIMEVL